MLLLIVAFSHEPLPFAPHLQITNFGMTPQPQNNLEVRSSLSETPFAEVLAELSNTQLSGSIKISNEAKKAIVYVEQGQVIYAVSNLRQDRLFEILLSTKYISKESLGQIEDFTNDHILTQALIDKALMTQSELDFVVTKQIEGIINGVLAWQTGEWVFSPLTRAKEVAKHPTDIRNLLLMHGRKLPEENASARFTSMQESFVVKTYEISGIHLLPEESFILSRLDQTFFISLGDIKNASRMGDELTFKTLYTLWLAGFVSRKNWNSAFSSKKVSEIQSAKLTLKKEEPKPEPPKPVAAPVINEELDDDVLGIGKEDSELSLEQYLDIVENAESYYEMMDVEIDADVSDIKTSYFNLAKRFHPDKYHKEADDKLLQRIQDAFTEIARGYETLKNKESREVYDFRLRKHLQTLKPKDILDEVKTGSEPAPAENTDQASEQFEQGFTLLMNGAYNEAVAYFARAVSLSPGNSRYHAYYGKALSKDDRQRHKAESELQTAIKMDPQNESYRIMLVEFYIYFGLVKRAEGELQRLLAQFPNNKEARSLLDTLPKK